MGDTAQRVVAEAYEWLGTPYLHQASCKGAGTDCLGLLRGIWRAIYGEEPELVPPYSADWSEPQGTEQLLFAAGRHLNERPKEEAALGDVILFRMRRYSVAKHLGVQVEVGASPKFIHAYSGQGVELSPLSAPWERRIAARFSFPN
ncbi:MAG: NlpC/P60 family protein [Litoreibacter sp.]|nr:NlpC/P60 family protein [Litoreibacter sp.]